MTEKLVLITSYVNDINVDDIDDRIKLYPSNFTDVLFIFPIITLKFLSSCSVESVCIDLIYPVRKRARFVTDSTAIEYFALMLLFGMAGCSCARFSIRGSMLLNLLFDNHLVETGRIGYSVSIVLALLVVLSQYREALFDIITHAS